MAHFIDDDVHFMATEVLPSCERENENFSDASRLLAKRLNFLSSLFLDATLPPLHRIFYNCANIELTNNNIEGYKMKLSVNICL